MYELDTKVQLLKYQVLSEVIREGWNDNLLEAMYSIPKKIVPGNKPTMRCCVYKERAILEERVKLAMGGNKRIANSVEVLEVACEECPAGGYEVTNACQGCLAHHCQGSCRFGAITIDDNHVAHIDKEKCKECGQCSKSCPYQAIISRKRPCISACKVKAISRNESGTAVVNNDSCISCGSCVYQCPFGAISDKSYVLNVIDMLKRAVNKQLSVYAIIAPSIAAQFSYASLGQVVTGIRALGFTDVMEVALGADMVAKEEARELAEKGFLISSCCPAFVSYIEKNHPDLLQYVSHNLSPMAALGKFIKEKDPKAKVVFIGPCTAKKMEVLRPNVKSYVDCAITFEELQAFFNARDIDITTLEEDKINDASSYGRIFARSGGLTAAMAEGLKELGFTDFQFKPVTCNGIEDCKLALLKKSKNMLDGNFIEGMACVGGCIGGAGNLTHREKNRLAIDKYGKEAGDKTIIEAVEAANK